MRKIRFKPIWFESLGAKSSCVLVKTPDVSILIDPGIAALQPSFPASRAELIRWERRGRTAIKNASKRADVIVISHYHYDHHMPGELEIYENKLLFVKNPNEWINDSQRIRAEYFLTNLYEKFGGKSLESLPPQPKEYVNPLDELEIAKRKDFGDYNERRRQVLKMGEKWFLRRVDRWKKYPVIPEFNVGRVRVKYPEGRKFRIGKTVLRFTKPMFHGVEYSRVGWVFATIIEYENEKLIHTSDLDGPVIEDYAEWIIKENPNTLILDGPMTYMLGYTFSLINLNRCIENMCRIIKNVQSELIIYDHHLLRDVRYRRRLRKVYETARELNKKVITAAEYLGKKPVADKYQK